MAVNLMVVCCMTILLGMASTARASLEVGFYDRTCPSAEALVRHAVSQAVAQDPGLAAGLIRLHFHDCFVRGCDASVLLDPTDPGSRVEKQARPNFPSLRGFEVIDAAKAAVEYDCPNTVSCADILAFAARDAAYLAGRIEWPVQAGRRDGRISLESEALANLPKANATVSELQENFGCKGLSLDEMVTLSGAHSIGRTLCAPFASRLYNFSPNQPQDPSLDPAFAADLKTKCPPSTLDPNANDLSRVMLDVETPYTLDNQYYKNLMRNKGVLITDQTLQTSHLTRRLVHQDAKHGSNWAAKFAAAMVKMGTIEVLTGTDGEVRKSCRVVNAY